MSATISSINYCPVKSISFQTVSDCKIRKNIGIVGDRVCFFNEGKIFEQGPPEQLFGNPQNERTKQFLHAVLDANWLSKCQKYTN